MWIKNYSAADVRTGSHQDPGFNSMLIQIVDTDDNFPKPQFKFKKIHQFKFGDFEDTDPFEEHRKISDQQAKAIVKALQYAIKHQMNVIVHCIVGVCRSGAVVEVGEMMGFEESHRWRAPNLRVKHKLMAALGWSYDPDESNYTTEIAIDD
jgi:protein tyrosine phosphatase